MCINRICIVCGKPFVQLKKGVQKYCSIDCKIKLRKIRSIDYRKNYKASHLKTCTVCGKQLNSAKAKYCKDCLSVINSRRMLGENNPSIKYPGRRVLSEEARQKISELKRGHSTSTGTIGINNGNINKRVLPEQLNDYINNGWELGWCANTISNKAPFSKISKAAMILYESLKDDPLYELKQEVSFENCIFKKQLPFDIGVYKRGSNFSELVCLIEYDGNQHQKPVKWNGTDNQYTNFIRRQVCDWLKDKFCIENNIPLVRIKEHYTYPLTFEKIYSSENTTLIGKAQNSDNLFQCFDILHTDVVNNRKISFTIESGITCTFKCDLENKCQLCQNFALTKETPKCITIDEIIEMYTKQSLAECISFQGLEPMDTLKQLLWFIYKFRKVSQDQLVIWTGYTEEECASFITLVNQMGWKNIILKFGRFRPNQEPHFDEILGVNLISDNQYAEQIS